MPRCLRIEFPGAIYHVLSRGDRREDIYHDDVDRQEFIKTLAEACLKTGWQIHAFCLMGNHFHLVVETPSASLSAGMHWFLSAYTLRLNHRHKLSGHVFSGRFKALLVEPGGGYLKTACDYVHLNPVRAGLLGPDERLLRYPWSSFPWYLSSRKHRPGWVRVDRLLGEHGIGVDSEAGRRQFEERMELGRQAEEEPEQLAPLRRGWCLGSAEFREAMLARAGEEAASNHEDSQLRQASAEARGRKILAEELKRRRWPERELKERRKSAPEKLAIAARMRKETILPMRTIAQLVGLGTTNTAYANLQAWKKQEKTQHAKC